MQLHARAVEGGAPAAGVRVVPTAATACGRAPAAARTSPSPASCTRRTPRRPSPRAPASPCTWRCPIVDLDGALGPALEAKRFPCAGAACNRWIGSDRGAGVWGLDVPPTSARLEPRTSPPPPPGGAAAMPGVQQIFVKAVTDAGGTSMAFAGDPWS